ncbi:MBL fold metallo-hydrolase [Kribbella qitaiheensis]|uniref:MBL fold metallo-hydrolase n=1 Tax=Kribbella qitaiheensis TaxID=1544730 RepID=A0A7G6X543_9ACTN|nr:MBL fold metallo-hydrolase [Kribbella qitaiheensis]QNE21358.1 MBL fold metallo-hydrolase [Kribbella qitaiheensis]
MPNEPTASLSPRRLTTLGHSCVLLELAAADGSVRRLILDPGNLTAPLTATVAVDAVLITHPHPDHVDPSQLAALAAGRELPIFGGAGLGSYLSEAGIDAVTELEPGEHEIAGIQVRVGSAPHEVIHPALPLPANLTYEIGGVFAPGDAFARPEGQTEVLLAPTGAPWMKLLETISYVAEVAPQRMVPVHDGGLGPAHRTLHTTVMKKFAPEGTEVSVLAPGQSLEF